MLINKLMIPGLKGLPELVLRGFRGAEDFPKMLACIEGSKAADGVERSDKLEDITNNYAHLHHCNPETDMCMAEVDGQVVGYCRVSWEIDEYAQQWAGFHFAYLLPEWRHKGIGSAMLRFTELRLAEIYAELKAAGEIPAEMPGVYDCFVNETARDTTHLLERRGYQPVRYGFNMVRPDLENIPDCPLPEELEVRPYQPEHLRKIWEASNEAFKDHWGYIAEPWEEYERLQHDSSFDPSLWRVAWEGDRVIGMVLSFIDKDENAEYGRLRGYTENICVRHEWRKRGVARALIALSLQALKERGMTEAGLGVDSENLSGALKLYQGMGYQVVKRGITYRKALGD
jgi:ribosomal protein S18 acetylase RimI-like enzyme